MALKNLFDMVKADRYTADGREALIKAQEAETEDKVYQIGDISQKTGLQKTANGWVKPKNGKQPGAKEGAAGKTSRASKEEAIRKDLGLTEGEDMSRFSDEQIEKMYAKTQQTPEQQKADFDKSKIGQAVNKGRQEFAAEKTRQKELASKTNAIGLPKESKPDGAEVHQQRGEEIKANLETAKYYFDKANSFSPTDPSYKTYMLKAKQYNDEAKKQADDNGFDFEEMHNAGLTQALNHYAKEQEINPTKTYLNEEGLRNFKAALDDNPKSRYDFAKTVEFAIPMSQNDKIELRKLQMFMSDEGTDYKQALRSRASNLVDGNKSNGDWFPEKEKSIMKIAKAVGYDKELHKFIEEEYKGYDLGYSEDAAPRVLTGDTRIRVRKA